MANKHGKCSISLAIRGMQIQATMRCHYIPIRMVKIKNMTALNAGKKLGNSYTVAGI